MALDERAFFTDRPETRQGRYQCPKCRRTADYSVRWVRRTKKDRLPPGATDEDRAKFAKLRDYLLRVEDRSEEHTSELQSPCNLVCRLLLEKKKKKKHNRQKHNCKLQDKQKNSK